MMIYVTLWEINIDPENHQFLEETNLPTPMTTRVELLIYWRLNLFSHWIVFFKGKSEAESHGKIYHQIDRAGLSGEHFPIIQGTDPPRYALMNRPWLVVGG